MTPDERVPDLPPEVAPLAAIVPPPPPPTQAEVIADFLAALGYDPAVASTHWTSPAPVQVCIDAMRAWSERARSIRTWSGVTPSTGEAPYRLVPELEALADELVTRGIRPDMVLAGFQQAVRDLRVRSKGIVGHSPVAAPPARA